jgi:hypothetical protein
MALGLAAGMQAQVTVLTSKTITCCEEGFSLAGVVRRAEEAIESLGLPGRRAVHFVSIIPTDRTQEFQIGGSTGDYPRDRCSAVARRIRKASSHAVLMLSPLGAAVHYWDAETQQAQYRILQGHDVFREEIEGGRIAWIDQGGDGRIKVYLVVSRSIPPAGYAMLARRTMDRLGIERATVLLRVDPHYWMDRCDPASIPLQWRPPFLTDAPIISPEIVVCAIEAGQPDPDCQSRRGR